MSTAYDELLGELQELAKAMPEDKPKVSADPSEDEDEDEELEESEGAEEPDAAADKPMTKSMPLTDADGNEVDAVDGSELIKSLQAQIDATHESVGKVFRAQTDMIKAQGELLKSLQAELKTMRSEGRGRKSVVDMSGVPGTLEKSSPVPATPSDVLAKCMESFNKGKLSALDVSIAEGYVNRGLTIPDHISRTFE